MRPERGVSSGPAVVGAPQSGPYDIDSGIPNRHIVFAGYTFDNGLVGGRARG